MYTLDKNEIIHYADDMLHDAFLFLIAGIASAAFGLIYEFFSHEVYSFYMIYAFLIPLVPGTLLNLVIVWRAVRKEKYLRNKEDAERRAMKAAEAEPYEDSEERGGISAGTEAQAGAGAFFPGPFTRHSWNSGLAALTIGSIFKGVLDIYGTTNKLIAVYPIAAAVLLCVSAFSFSMSYAAMKKTCKNVKASAV